MSDGNHSSSGPQPASSRGERTSSDAVIRDVLRTSAKEGVPACFLRLGAPRKFRDEVIQVSLGSGKSTEAYELLTDSNLPQVAFVLVDPRFPPFLKRMDSEKKSLQEIWRIRDEVIAFARGLLRIGYDRRAQGLSTLQIVLHRQPLLWSLSCAGQIKMVVRAYHGQYSGHDNGVEELVLSAGNPARLGEAMWGYYESVRDAADSHTVHDEHDLEALRQWPSLFKANAVWPAARDPDSAIVKVVDCEETRIAEVLWLKTRSAEARSCQYFRPVPLRSARVKHEPEYGGRGLQVQRVSGVTAEEFVHWVQLAGHNDSHVRPILEAALNAVLRQAIRALREFHAVGQSLVNGKSSQLRLAPYPWRLKLQHALNEVGRFITSDRRLLRDCSDVLLACGEYLECRGQLPFRDAHLKNRLIAVPPKVLESGLEGVVAWFREFDPGSIADWLLRNTFDIDFETAGHEVPASDDAMHILFSPGLGWRHQHLLEHDCQSIRQWWPESQDIAEIERTALCRCFRELCRRIWYAQVMPRAYSLRYRAEPWDHFLRVPQYIAERSLDWEPIEKLLDICQERRAALFPDANLSVSPASVFADPTPMEAAAVPSNTGRRQHASSASSVFISSHHIDYQHAHRLHDYLMSRGISSFFCERSMSIGKNANFVKQINDALAVCRHMIIVASRPDHLHSEWVALEWNVFLAIKNARRLSGNIVTVVAGSLATTELPELLQVFQVLTLEEALAGELLPYVQGDERNPAQ